MFFLLERIPVRELLLIDTQCVGGRAQVCNHTAAVDDPFVISSVLPPHKLLNSRNLRWTLCATEKCFSSPATAAFFRSVKVLPLTKGHGVFQQVRSALAHI
jgi:hypothetical protein